MDDVPLFRNTDEQEATYAPQGLPQEDPAARRPTDELGGSNAGGSNPGIDTGGVVGLSSIGATSGAAEIPPGVPDVPTSDDDTDAANRGAETSGSTSSQT